MSVDVPSAALRLGVPLAGADLWAGQTVGLLGGSFNPAHDGHRTIAERALTCLGVDWVWWLVSPQNPLKSSQGMASLGARLASAERQIAGHPRMRASCVETTLGTQYTAQTLERLIQAHPRIQFVWLMGADNLVQFHRWQHWRQIAQLAPIAVFDRAGGKHAAITSHAAKALRHRRQSPGRHFGKARQRLPRWTFVYGPRHPLSSTVLRQRGQC